MPSSSGGGLSNADVDFSPALQVRRRPRLLLRAGRIAGASGRQRRASERLGTQMLRATCIPKAAGAKRNRETPAAGRHGGRRGGGGRRQQRPGGHCTPAGRRARAAAAVPRAGGGAGGRRRGGAGAAGAAAVGAGAVKVTESEPVSGLVEVVDFRTAACLPLARTRCVERGALGAPPCRQTRTRQAAPKSRRQTSRAGRLHRCAQGRVPCRLAHN